MTPSKLEGEDQVRFVLYLVFVIVFLWGLISYMRSVIGQPRRPTESPVQSEITPRGAVNSLARVGIVRVPGSPTSFATYGTAFAIGHHRDSPTRYYFLTCRASFYGQDCVIQWQPESHQWPCTATAWLLGDAQGLAVIAANIGGSMPPRVLELESAVSGLATQPILALGFVDNKVRYHHTTAIQVETHTLRGRKQQLRLTDRCPGLGTFRGAPLLNADGKAIGVYVRGRAPPIGVNCQDINRLLIRLDIQLHSNDEGD